MRSWDVTKWRAVLARLPLPMLALAASYGVYSFALLFVPPWVAIVQAAAFEITYIGLAAQRDMPRAARERAGAISVGAVLVSILYNTLAGLFHRNPAWLVDLWWPHEWGLALLHGAPLAWVAYLVADLLLHDTSAAHPVAEVRDEPRGVLEFTQAAREDAQPAPVEVRDPAAAVARLREDGANDRGIARALAAEFALGARPIGRLIGRHESTVRGWLI